MGPLLSIGLPFYNNADSLEYTLKSVYAQTFTDWELIAVDDGSADGGGDLVEKLARQDPRIRFVQDGKNRGLVYRLNQLSSLAKGKYLARMDADDLMSPERMSRQIARLEADPSIDVVDSGAWSVDEHLNPVGIRGLEEIARHPKDILKTAMLFHASIVGKAGWFRANPYDPAYLRAEDYELWCRTHATSRFERVNEPLYIVKEGKVNVKNYAASLRTVKKILKTYGPSHFKPAELRAELLKSDLKIAAYKLFGAFGRQDILSGKRNRKLNETETRQLKAILTQILETPLPL